MDPAAQRTRIAAATTREVEIARPKVNVPPALATTFRRRLPCQT